MDLFSLKGKNAVVTGGTGVLGQVMCKGLVSAGASVAILGRRKDAAEKLANEIKSSGGKAIAVTADVLNKEQLLSARTSIQKELGPIDILVNAAGGNIAGAVIPPDKNFFDLDLKAFED